MNRIITEKWLKEKKACERSFVYAKNNNWIGLTLEQSIDLLLHNNRFDDASWLLIRCMDKFQCVKYAVFAAEQVIGIFEERYADDRPIKAIEAAKEYINLKMYKHIKKYITDAYDASYAVYNDSAAAYAAYAAADAAYTSAAAAGYTDAAYAAYAAAYASADAAYAAYDDATSAYDAAYGIHDISVNKYNIKTKIIKNGIKIIKKE